MKPEHFRSSFLRHLVLLPLFAASVLTASASPSVKVTEQDIVIPTYLAGEPEPNPMFYFGRQ